jgi:predicted AlkP superfamily phosphohydrolase/phosphomutase
MKLLVIGIDGGTKRIFDYMPMPFTHSLFSRASSKVLKEDLISRGWAEILTGKHASETGGFYLKPVCNKTYRFDQSYGMKDMTAAPEVDALWSRLNKKGVRVGISNVPTTGPAPEVDGFVIAGGGGGMKAGKGISPSSVYPPEDLPILINNDYVFDIRLPRNVRSFASFADSLTEAQEVQKNTFIAMSEKHKPGFGFHCFRITTELQYLALSEIDLYIERVIDQKGNTNEVMPQNLVQSKVVEHYIHMDNCIRDIFESLKPEHYLFIADHSTKPLRYEVDIDVLLERFGLLTHMGSIEEYSYRTTLFTKKAMNRFRKKFNLKGSWRPHRFPFTRFNKLSTEAFGTFFDTGNFGGIFINDEERFGGPVRSKSKINSLVKEICVAINTSQEAAEWNLHARPYRSNFKNSKYQCFMPDIKIEKPDELYFTCRKGKFIVPNNNYGPVPENISGIRYPFTGVKGSDPLFVYSNSLQHLIEDGDPADLRLAYLLIDRYF